MKNIARFTPKSPIASAFLLAFFVACPVFAGTYSGGDGSEGNPYQIANLNDLQELQNTSDDWGTHFIQTADIDASDTSTWDGGAGWTPIIDDTSGFTGVYDGQCYAIDGLFINREAIYQGMFGWVDGATIKNLSLTHLNITATNYVGGLAGLNTGTISDCRTSGAVSGTDHVGGLVGHNLGPVSDCSSSCAVNSDGSEVGGLVGWNDVLDPYTGGISRCYATGAVTHTGAFDDASAGGLVGYNKGTVSQSFATGAVTSAKDQVGGLVGYNDGTISDCYARGAANGDDFIGGLVGVNWGGTIGNCYATGLVTGDDLVGGLLGFNLTDAVSDCFWNTDVFADPGIGGGVTTGATGKNTIQMKTKSTFTDAGWDFANIWHISVGFNDGYPQLRWVFYYRSKNTGNWSNTGMWEISEDGATWIDADAPPDSTCRGITIRNGHTATVDADVTIDQTTVETGGTLAVNDGVTLTVADGSGTDLDVNGGLSLVDDAVVNVNGSFDATGGSVTFTGAGALCLGGDVVSLGTLTPAEGTVGFIGTASQTITGSNTFYDLTIDKDNATDTVDASGSTLAVTNGLSVTTGIFTSASAFKNVVISPLGTLRLSGDITVSGEWWNLFGTFTHNNHTVTLNGADQYILGSTTFYNLTKQIAAADTLEFESDSTTTVTNALTLEGAAGQPLSLRSDWVGHQWNIDPQGTRNIAHVDVRDSSNVNATAINAGEGSVNSGNNVNWLFCPTVITQAVTNITTTTATGNGNITDLGVPNPTAHGVCWATTTNPTTADSKTNKGGASSTGAFTASITGLTEGTTYHVRAFAANTAGTSYGADVEFKTKAALTMAASPAGSGTTTPAVGSTTNVDAGVAQDITASAATGHHFVNWTADPAGNATFGNPASTSTTVTLTGSATVTASFALNTYTLTAAANPGAGGIIAKNPNQAAYNHGENVQVTAMANANYAFTGWSGDLSGTSNPATITMDGNKTVTANFAPTYAVTYNGNGNTGGSPPVDGSSPYTAGASVTVLGNTGNLVRTGYTFSNWNTAADGSGTSYAPGAQFAMPGANVTLYAQWTPEVIPTLSEWGMIILMGLLAGITLWRLRRQRTM